MAAKEALFATMTDSRTKRPDWSVRAETVCDCGPSVSELSRPGRPPVDRAAGRAVYFRVLQQSQQPGAIVGAPQHGQQLSFMSVSFLLPFSPRHETRTVAEAVPGSCG